MTIGMEGGGDNSQAREFLYEAPRCADRMSRKAMKTGAGAGPHS